MRKILFLTCLIFTNATALFSQSQGEMNETGFNKYKKVDRQLNSVYKKIVAEYSKDTLFIKNFVTAQKAWIKFRDAEMISRFPNYDGYGSSFPMCWYSVLQELTEERTKNLKLWLTGMPEGDLCSGSVKTIHN